MEDFIGSQGCRRQWPVASKMAAETSDKKRRTKGSSRRVTAVLVSEVELDLIDWRGGGLRCRGDARLFPDVLLKKSTWNIHEYRRICPP